MTGDPVTLDDARKIRYGKSAASAGAPYREGYCAERVARGRWVGSRQCSRKIVNGIWCRQHHPDAVKRREAESSARFQRHMDNLPAVRAVRYREALEKIADRRPETPTLDVAYMRAVAREAIADEGRE